MTKAQRKALNEALASMRAARSVMRSMGMEATPRRLYYAAMQLKKAFKL